MMTVLCVLRSGGGYNVSDVQKLHNMVSRHLDFDMFVCLTDRPDDVRDVRGVMPMVLQHNWSGWWSKIECFRPLFKAAANQTILYIDLDTIIVGSIQQLVEVVPRWVVIGDFYRRPPNEPRIRYGSGLMLWNNSEQQKIYTEFVKDPERAMRLAGRWGDQDWIERISPWAAFWEDLLPGQVVSYKVHCKSGLPKDARVVCFHGVPKPNDCVQLPWVQEHYQ